jgi:hypothetical protein
VVLFLAGERVFFSSLKHPAPVKETSSILFSG